MLGQNSAHPAKPRFFQVLHRPGIVDGTRRLSQFAKKGAQADAQAQLGVFGGQMSPHPSFCPPLWGPQPPQRMMRMIFCLLIGLPSALATYAHEMGCRAEVSDAFRYTVVNNLNAYRELVANGSAPNKCGMLPPARNMYKLFYDCDLETQAYTYASSCGSTTMPSNSYIWMNMGSATFSEANILSYFIQRFTDNLNAVVSNGTDSQATVTASLAGWSQGCDSGNPSYPNKLYSVCVWDSPKAGTNAAAYETGAKCASDADCTTHLGSTCIAESGLCAYQFVEDSSNRCEGISDALNDGERDLVLNWHNLLRSSLARGLEDDGGNYAGQKAPAAARMTKMRYNCQVEASAKSWAENCVYKHSDAAQRPGKGENLYMSTSTTMSNEQALADAPQRWWDELPMYGVGTDLTFNSPQINTSVVGHYTQMAWQTTTDLGCAVGHCSNMTFVVCQYSPPGNYLGEKIYEAGNACSTNADCGAGQTCLPAEGLCSLD